MRNAFESTVLAIDDLVAELQNAIGKQEGAQMTSDVFDGATVAIMVKRPNPGVATL